MIPNFGVFSFFFYFIFYHQNKVFTTNCSKMIMSYRKKQNLCTESKIKRIKNCGKIFQKNSSPEKVNWTLCTSVIKIVRKHDNFFLSLWGECIRTYSGHVDDINDCCISKDGTKLFSASDDGSLKCWDVNSGAILKTFSGHSDRVTCCTLSSNGLLLFSGSDDHDLKCWNINTGKTFQTFKGHTGQVKCCTLMSNNSFLFSGGIDGILKCWEVDNGTIQIE